MYRQGINNFSGFSNLAAGIKKQQEEKAKQEAAAKAAAEAAARKQREDAQNAIIAQSHATGQPMSALQQAELDRRTNEALAVKNSGGDGKPQDLSWNYLTGLDGTLQDQYRLGDWQNVTANTQGMDKYGQEALRDAGSLSTWGKAMTDKMGVDKATALDSSARQSANALTQAQNQLAQTGGLSGAARERMATGSARNAMLDRNNVMRTAQLDQYNLAAQDEGNRMTQLNTYQGMQNQQADIQFKNQQQQGQVDQFNIGNTFNENNAKRMFDSGQYSEKMQAWAANKSADAQKQAAKGGGKK